MLNKDYTRENTELLKILREYSSDLSTMDRNEIATIKLFLGNIRVIIRSQGGKKYGVVLNHKLKNLLVYLNSII